MNETKQLRIPDWCQAGVEVIRKCAGADGSIWVPDRVRSVEEQRVVLWSGAELRTHRFIPSNKVGVYQDELYPMDDPEARVALWACTVKRRAAELSRITAAMANSPRPAGQLVSQSKTLVQQLSAAEEEWKKALREMSSTV